MPDTRYAAFPEDELLTRFTYHAPTPDQMHRYEAIRAQALDFARTICALTPPSPEQFRAINALDEVVMLANAAIARREETTQ